MVNGFGTGEYNVKPFGLNVIPDGKSTAQATAKVIEEAIGSLWEPMLDYLKANENVFSGDVSSAINKLNIQTMQLGTIVNNDKVMRNLDMQF